MSTDKPSDPSDGQVDSTEADTVLTRPNTEGSGAHRRPIGEYSFKRTELSGTHRRPEPSSPPPTAPAPAPSASAHRPSSPPPTSGPAEKTIITNPSPVPVPAAASPSRPLPGMPAAKQTVIQPGGGIPMPTNPTANGTPVPPVGTVPPPASSTQPPNLAHARETARSRRSSEAPSVRSSQWDRNIDREDSNPSTTGVHAAANQPHPGVRINQYEMIKLIGEGGMGTVWLARDLRLGRRVAIKFLQSDQAELTQRFLVEARATARCQHDNIVVIYEVGEHAGAPYMVLEYLTGKPLTQSIKSGQRLPYSRAVEIMISVLRALECAHGQGIVHRDLKPDNIFVTDSGTLKVLDFGIAKVLEAQHSGTPAVNSSGAAIRMPSPLELATGSNTSLTRHGTIMGTLKYMSPEQWGIGVEIDHLSDIWACGVLLHRMICGRHPLHPLDGNQLVVTAMLELPMPSMTDAAPPDVPRELIQIVDKCLMKIKQQRWQSTTELLHALEPFLPGRRTQQLQIDESPYAGLSSFQEADAGKFFGRNREIAAMVTRIRDRPLMAVVGSSGVGKSSFVRAGLVPALKRSGETWETLVIRPGRNPLEALASLIAPMVATAANLADEVEEQRKLVETLKRAPGHLGHVLRGRARRDNRRILLFIDQFEELYTQVQDAEERAAFTACISAVADDATSPLRVVLSVRSDFLDRAAEDQQFVSDLTQGLFFLGPPNREGLRDAIVQPAELAGFQFELAATVEDMLDHLETTPGALPLLQFAAAKLWDNRDSSRKLLTHQSYAAMGGVAGALASHADRVVQDIGPQNAPLVRAILLRLVTPERTRAIMPMEELRELSREVGQVQHLVDQMVDARLLVVQNLEGGKGSTVEIVHESLVQGWPMLRRWLDENQDDAALVDQLRTSARQWYQKGRSPDLLWRGETADEAKKFKKRYKGPLSDVERSFLDEVINYELAVQRRRRTAVVGGFVGLGALMIAAMVALVMIQKSRTEAKRQAIIAVQAQGEAEDNLKSMQQKEKERQTAEAERAKVEAAKQVVDVKLDQSQEDLRKERDQLKIALEEAKQAEERARAAAGLAQENERKAEKASGFAEAAKEEAIIARGQAEAAYRKEEARVKDLQKQIGSPIVDDLK